MQITCIIKSMRTNVYREKILQVLSTNHLLSISDIREKIATANQSTIYRNVEQMVSEGILRKIVLDKNTVLYESIKKENEHDHFLCVDCGDFESIQPMHTPNSLSDKRMIHDVFVRGLCEKCNTKS